MYKPSNPKFKTLQEEFESMGLDPDEAVAVIKATGMREFPTVRVNDPRVPLMRNNKREDWQQDFVEAVVTEKRYSRAPRGASKTKAKRNYRKIRSKERIRAKRYRKSAAGKRAKRVSKRKLSRIKPRAGYRRQVSDTDVVANIVDRIQDIATHAHGDKALNVIEQHVMAMDKCEWVCWELADRFDDCQEWGTADTLDSLAEVAHGLADELNTGDVTLDELEERMQEVVSRVAEALSLYDAADDTEDQLAESRDGLNDNTVKELIDMAGESAELDGAGSGGRNVGKIPSSVAKEVKKFEKDCKKALEDWVKKNRDQMAEDDIDADTLYDEKGAYLVLMTLRGEGVGIWDGDWDDFFVDGEVPKDLEKHLERKLQKYADDSGGGSLNQAFEDAAYDVYGGSDEDLDESVASGLAKKLAAIIRKVKGKSTAKELNTALEAATPDLKVREEAIVKALKVVFKPGQTLMLTWGNYGERDLTMQKNGKFVDNQAVLWVKSEDIAKDIAKLQARSIKRYKPAQFDPKLDAFFNEQVKKDRKTHAAVRTLSMGGMRSDMSTADAVVALRDAGMSDEDIQEIISQSDMDPRAVKKAMGPENPYAKIKRMYDSETPGGQELIEAVFSLGTGSMRELEKDVIGLFPGQEYFLGGSDRTTRNTASSAPLGTT